MRRNYRSSVSAGARPNWPDRAHYPCYTIGDKATGSMSNYVPKKQRTPEQWEAYLAACRVRNRRSYERRRNRADPALVTHLQEHGTVPCSNCGIETVPICGFCKDGLH